jgi:hypothetical protein
LCPITWTPPGEHEGKPLSVMLEFEETPFKIDLQGVSFTPMTGKR